MRRLQSSLIVLVAVVTVVLALFAVPVSYAAPARPLTSWNCTNPECQGVNYHTYASGSAQGVASSIQLEPIACAVTGTTCAAKEWGISNLAQVDENDVGGFYFVVAGAIRPGTSIHGGYSYYWEDFRPGDNSPNPHWMAYVSSSSYGLYERYTIGDTATDYTTYDITFSGQYNLTGQQSVSNFMSGNEVIIGTELLGDSPPMTAAQDGVFFEYNERLYNQSWAYFTTNGTDDVNTPVLASWTVYPTTSGSHGGEWNSFCTC